MSGGAKIEILRLLNARGPMHGLHLVKASEKLSRLTIYHHLNILEDGGFVASKVVREDGRRAYEITDTGKNALSKSMETK